MSATYLPAFQKAVPQALQRSVPQQILAVFRNPDNLLEGGALAQIRTAFASRGAAGVAAFEQLREAMKVALTQGLHTVFLLCLGIILAAFVTVWFLKEVPLRDRRRKKVAEPDENLAPLSEVGPALS